LFTAYNVWDLRRRNQQIGRKEAREEDVEIRKRRKKEGQRLNR
jgi:hypothetical protein